jgi:hypothetical protein
MIEMADYRKFVAKDETRFVADVLSVALITVMGLPSCIFKNYPG